MLTKIGQNTRIATVRMGISAPYCSSRGQRQRRISQNRAQAGRYSSMLSSSRPRPSQTPPRARAASTAAAGGTMAVMWHSTGSIRRWGAGSQTKLSSRSSR